LFFQKKTTTYSKALEFGS